MAIKTGTITASFTKRGAKSGTLTGIDAGYLKGTSAMGVTSVTSGATVFLYGLDFENLKKYLDKKLRITGFSIQVEGRSYSVTSSITATVSFHVVSGFNTSTSSTDINTYTDIGGKSVTVFSEGKAASRVTTLTETDISTNFLTWINANLNAVLNGYTSNSFGIRAYLKYAVVNPFYVTLDYEYEEVEYVTVSTSVTPTGAGTVSPATQQIESGATATVTATPNAGYKFSHWLLDGADSGIITPTLSGTVTSNLLCTAVFVLDKITNAYRGTTKQDVFKGNSKIQVYKGTKKVYG